MSRSRYDRWTLLVAAFAAACGSSPTPATDAGMDAGANQVVVQTESGPVEGLLDAFDPVYVFPNLPFAAPPTNENRFRAPQPVTPWTATRPASNVPKTCPQVLPFGTGGLASGVEDCLYVSVVVPNPMPTNAPVVVWFHGGGFAIGSGEQADRGTNGKLLAAEQGVIFVRFNYRLGQLGFLAHAALDDEQGGHSGNYGLLDQLAALRWVKRNIEAFGGDPDAITVWGQSAGGMSVCALMASPLMTDPSVVPVAEQPLFHRAVLQSAPCDVPLPSLATARTQGADFAVLVGCDDASNPRTPAEVRACLRDPTMLTMAEARDTLRMANDFIRPNFANGERSWGPIVDGWLVPEHPVDRIAAGNFVQVPVLAGMTDDEGNTSMHFRLARSASPANMITRITDATIFDSEFSKLFAGGAQQSDRDAVYQGTSPQPRFLASTYTAIPTNPAITGLSPAELTPYEQVLAVLHGDMDLLCPERRTLRALEAAGVSVRAYAFRQKDPPFQVTPAFPLGAFHSSDVQMFFGVPAGGLVFPMQFDPDEEALSTTMRAYLGAFVRTGDPNGGGRVAWPAYTSSSPTHLAFEATVATVTDPWATQCAPFDALGRARIGVP